MGLLWIVLITMLWSMIGIFVKSASTMLDSGTITFLRFAIGVAILAVWYRWKHGKLRVERKGGWIWAGAFGKSGNYMFENAGIALGLSYGYIISSPVTFVITLLMTVVLFRERVSRAEWMAAGLSLIGIMVINWNGLPLDQLVEENGFITLLFVLSGIGVAFHFVSQKKLVETMEPMGMNLSVFFWCMLLSAIPLPFQFEWKGQVSVAAVGSILMLGAITGVSFYLFSLALRQVSFFLASVIVNLSVLFSVLWGYLLYDEPVSAYVVGGIGLFVVGMLVVNIERRRKIRENKQLG